MINILMAGDVRVYPGIELAIYSTLTHNKGINWHIFTMSITIERGDGLCQDFIGLQDWHKNKQKKIVTYLDPTSRIVFHDVKDLYIKHFWKNPNEWSGFTPYAGLRLLADLELKYTDHILYLDCDVAVQGDITSMYWEYLSKGYEYCAYVCPEACDNNGEMVSGVMLMNLKKIRETGFLERARKNVNTHVYKYYDQDALRDAGKPYPLPETYGYLEELEKCPYDPIILHFTNRLQPKVYDDKGITYFYRRYPKLEYVKKGVELLDTFELQT